MQDFRAAEARRATGRRDCLPLSPLHLNYSLGRIPKRGADGRRRGSGWEQSDVRVPKLIFEHKRVAANIEKESTFINKY